MPYIKMVSVNCGEKHHFPFNVPGIKFAKDIDLSSSVNFIIGDNGTGKSTLIEAIAFRLQLPHMDGSDYVKRSFHAAIEIAPYLDISYNIDRTTGFFFRAEDFGDYINSVDRSDAVLHAQLNDLHGKVPDHIIQQMKENANQQLYHMRRNYGQELSTFSHGEAYLKIIHEKVSKKGIFILDEPEAALSPAKQLSLIYHIKEHLRTHQSQFIIATHSPIIMSVPGSQIYEITEEKIGKTNVEDTEHYIITKGFLNSPESYLKHL